MNHLTHEVVRDLLAGAAFEVLEPDERALVLDHLTGCADCAEQLVAYREVVGLLVGALAPPYELTGDRATRLRGRLIARTAAEQGVGAGTSRQMYPRGKRARAALASRWAGWAFAAGLMSILLFHHGLHRPFGAGWIAAAVFGVVAVALGIYAAVQRRRVASLRAELKTRRPPNTRLRA